jgi:serine/threonine protein kinase/Tol biopolymer transport system component
MAELVERLAAALAGRYAIEREIGAGGMALVYLARDLKHNRKVALKVLRPELGAVLGVERFLSEIQVTANLQHPNLLPLFDSGEADGQLFYVMPYVEGESLRKRLERERQLPISDAVHIATSVASALDYAHRHGVIHRDLKPENILLHDGEPLVADFGIALAVSNAGGHRVTQTGLSLGTPQYMSPEQATGDRAVDRRADVYSLAAVTYEMLVGEAPHTGATSQAIIARVLTERPRPVRATRPSVPVQVERAIEQALEKLPADRLGTAREFADALAGRGAPPAIGVAAPAGSPRRDLALRVALGISGILWLATLPVLLRSEPAEREATFTVTTPNEPRNSATPLLVELSPDGRFLAYVGSPTTGATPVLWLRALNEAEAQPMKGTEGARLPFWSPDSRQIAFFSGNYLKRIDLEGGSPQNIADLGGRDARGGTWNADNVIVVARAGALQRVSAGGGPPVQVTTLDADEAWHGSPVFLSDSRRFLFLSWSSKSEERGIYLGTLEGGPPSLLLAVESKPVYVPPDLLLYHRRGTLLAQRFDAKRSRMIGEPVQLAVGVRFQGVGGLGAFSASHDGVLAYRAGIQGSATTLGWFSRDGANLGNAGDSAGYHQIRLSPDDRMVATDRIDRATGIPDLWTLDVASGVSTRLTFETLTLGDPVWFPDGKTVAFWSVRNGFPNFYKKVLGARNDTPLLESQETKWLNDISQDGRYLLYQRGNSRLMALPLTQGGASIPLTDSSHTRDEASFSPDGRWFAYGSNESGTWEVYVASFPESEKHTKISQQGGVQARWRADGKEIFYLSPEGAVMSVQFTPEASTPFSAPVQLFQSPLGTPSATIDEFDVTRDGRRFLFIVPLEGSQTVPITVRLNWLKGFGG